MKDRVQIWMDRAKFLEAIQALYATELADCGPLEDLLVALEEAQRNESNYDPGEVISGEEPLG